MQIVMSCGDKNLITGSSSSFQFTWYQFTEEKPSRDADLNCDMRARGYVYLCGFDDKQKAVDYGINEGFIEM